MKAEVEDEETELVQVLRRQSRAEIFMPVQRRMVGKH
jgi:hypothetical protein